MNTFKKIAEGLQDKIRDHFTTPKPTVDTGQISIGITTFEERFERHFIPLLRRIRSYGVQNEIIVAINGEHERAFGEDYRQRILTFIAGCQNVYPVVFPRFRGLSKLWNSVIIHATQDYVLMLNDDIMITKPTFLEDIASAIRRNQGRTFLINSSWSHFVMNR